MALKKEFVPYELAVKLKELGYPQDNIGLGYVLGDYYNTEGDFNGCCIKVIKDRTNKLTKAPLWQQAFCWFRHIHCLHGDIYRNGTKYLFVIEDMTLGNSIDSCDIPMEYEQSRYACLEKLIEIVSCKSEN